MNRLLEAVLRTDLRFFIRKVFVTVCPGEPYLHNWHIEAIAYQLERVFLGETTRLLINQPPRSLKSICVSVAYFAWLLGRDPTRRVIVVSYSGDFAAELHRQFRQVASSEWYAALFPHTRWAKETGLEFVTTLGGGRYATSVGGTLTGRGADLIVIDDPLNAAEAQSEAARKRVIDWFGDRSSRASTTSAPEHRRSDAAAARGRSRRPCSAPGRLGASRFASDRGRRASFSAWTRKVPSSPRRRCTASGTRGLAALEALKRELGGMMFSAQYQQRPVPLEGNLIRRAWFRYSRHHPCRRPPIRPRSFKAGTSPCRQAKRTTTQSAPPGAPTGTTFTCSTFPWPARISRAAAQGNRAGPGARMQQRAD